MQDILTSFVCYDTDNGFFFKGIYTSGFKFLLNVKNNNKIKNNINTIYNAFKEKLKLKSCVKSGIIASILYLKYISKIDFLLKNNFIVCILEKKFFDLPSPPPK